MLYVILFFGFLVQSVSGFGAGLFSVPLLTLTYEPRFIVPAFAITVWLLNIATAFETRKSIRWNRVWKIVIFSWISLPIGVYFLANLNQAILRLFISALTLALGLLFLFGVKPSLKDTPFTYVTGGIVSGLLSGAAAMGGPPLILMGYSMGWKKNEFRATLLTCFAVNGTVSVLMFYANGLILPANLKIVLFALPCALLAIIAGIKIKNLLDEEFFTKAVLVLILIIGASGILRFFML